MSWTIDGRPILFDPSGEASEFIKDYLASDRLSQSAPWSRLDDQADTVIGGKHGRRLARSNWENQPPLEVNRVWNPSGATRWAQAAVLMDYDAMRSLSSIRLSWRTGTAVTLKISDTISLQMYLLNPVQVSATNNAEPTAVFLIPLVDERYFWQWSTHDLDITSSSTWTTVIDALAGTLNISTNNIEYPDSRFISPDATELSRHGNAAVLLDSILQSTGLRLVHDFANGFKIKKIVTDAKTLTDDDGKLFSTTGAHLAGEAFERTGGFEKVELICPRRIDDVLRDDLDPFILSVDVGSTHFKTGLKATLYTTAHATDTQAAYDADPATPSNQSTLQSLAEAIAETYKRSNDTGNYDVTWPGFEQLSYASLLDSIEYRITNDGKPRRRARGAANRYEGAATTRARTIANLFGSHYQLSQDGFYEHQGSGSEGCDFTLTEDMDQSTETAAATIAYSWPIDRPSKSITVRNMPAGTAGGYHWEGSIGHKGRAVFNRKENRFEVVEMEDASSGDTGGTTDPSLGRDCSLFAPGTTPKYFRFEAAGFSIGSCTAAECAEVFDREVLLTQPDIGDPCIWENSDGVVGSCARWDLAQLIAIPDGPSGGILRLDFTRTGGTNFYSYRFQWGFAQLVDGRTIDEIVNTGFDDDSQCSIVVGGTYRLVAI